MRVFVQPLARDLFPDSAGGGAGVAGGADSGTRDVLASPVSALHVRPTAVQHAATCAARALQLAALWCNTLQRSATGCNAVQQVTTQCNKSQQVAMHCDKLQQVACASTAPAAVFPPAARLHYVEYTVLQPSATCCNAANGMLQPKKIDAALPPVVPSVPNVAELSSSLPPLLRASS